MYQAIKKALCLGAVAVVISWASAHAREITLTDQAGREVNVPHPVRHAAVVTVNLEESILAIGAWDQIVSHPRTGLGNRLLAILDPPRKITGSFSSEGTLNLETLVRSLPDAVITWRGNSQIIERITQLGMPVVTVHPRDYEGLMTMLRLLGKVFGREERVRFLTERIEGLMGKVEGIGSGAARVRVLFLGGTPTLVYGTKWLFHDMIEKAGGKDVCADLDFKPWVAELPVERIVMLDPEVVIIGGWAPYGPEDIIADPRWSSVAAVRSGRVYKTPAGRANFSPYSTLLMIMTARWCYPERLGVREASRMLNEYHQSFYGVDFDSVHPGYVESSLR